MAVGPSQAPITPMATASELGETEKQGETDGQKDAKLAGGSEQKYFRVFQEWARNRSSRRCR